MGQQLQFITPQSAAAADADKPAPRRELRLGELFCGAGGTALGAHTVKHRGRSFRHVWVTDIDKDACRTISQIIPQNRIYPIDVRSFMPLMDELEPIDGLVFGFPCNDFSQIGERAGSKGLHGDMYLYAVEALNKLNPGFFVAENVKGLASSNQHKDLPRILEALTEAGYGYHVSKHLYKLEEYGIPQRRHRYIIVGFRSDFGTMFAHPSPNGRSVSCEEALAGIPEDAANNETPKQSEKVTKRLSYIKPGENIFTAEMPDSLRFKMRSKATISQLYRKLIPNEPAYTVTASGGGGTHLYHWSENRGLTNRERARLQTFPDEYVFHGGMGSVRKQIGMAVPPNAAKIIFRAVLEQFNPPTDPVEASHVGYETIPPNLQEAML